MHTFTPRRRTGRGAVRTAIAGVACVVALGAVSACSNDDDTSGEAPEAAVNTTAVPDDLTMRSLGGIETPMSAKDGPSIGVPPQGYSHTPQGAALAAANGQAALATAPDAQWAETVRTVTAPGPGRDEFASARAMLTVTESVPEDAASTFEGFKVTDYSEDKAIVLLASTSPDGGEGELVTAYPVQLTWTGGDWKLVLPRQEDNIDATEIDGLDGFSLWKENQ